MRREREQQPEPLQEAVQRLFDHTAPEPSVSELNRWARDSASIPKLRTISRPLGAWSVRTPIVAMACLAFFWTTIEQPHHEGEPNHGQVQIVGHTSSGDAGFLISGLLPERGDESVGFEFLHAGSVDEALLEQAFQTVLSENI